MSNILVKENIVLGLDSVYSFIQTLVVFVFGSTSIVMANKNLNFILSLIGMMIISTLLYKLVFGKNNNGIMFYRERSG